ncbi:MAG: tRNA (adenosine(37)-N6)-threonylcarbamoyltransferase complex ATPase subunit type 1 TsaE [Deltaproteobacteria bacterium]|nr:tRNA (adenosine(37)-N6)-threonylcarbamoyltransferase complex ATPase subunit type 1 TsaE [Deltaproteobacteria bacterium]
MDTPARQIAVATAADMKALGRALGRAMSVGDVVGLIGPLGAGKTTLAQGIAEGLEVPPDRHVASPTFALVNEHPARVRFVHADFYRLRDHTELTELGLDEIFDRAAVVIEWVDLFPDAVPADHLTITIAPADHGQRIVSLHAIGPIGLRLAASIDPAG